MTPRDKLYLAIKNNHTQAVADFISQVNQKEMPESKEGTPIELAVSLGHWECVEAIAKNKKTDADDVARYGMALVKAVDANRLTTAKILLEAGAPTNRIKPDASLDTCLHLAVRRRNIDMIKLLSEHKADITKQNGENLTPIELAFHLNFWDCVEVIAGKNKKDTTDAAKYSHVLLRAVEGKRYDTAKILLQAGAYDSRAPWIIIQSGDSCLHLAIRNKQIEMVHLLLSAGVDVTTENKDKRTPIQLACDLKQWECVEAIAKNKKTDAQDAAKYEAALVEAVDANRLSTAKILLEAGARTTGVKLDISLDTSLHLAVRKRNIDMIKLLSEHKVDITQQNGDKNTPIILACSLGYWDCVEAIAEKNKTDSEDAAKYGHVLLRAVQAKSFDTAKILLRAGAPLSHFLVNSGDSCLHLAIINNQIEMVLLLLSAGADVTMKNKENKTPIQLACDKKHWECVKAIACNTKRDKHGYMAVDKDDNAGYGYALMAAIKNNRPDVALILLETRVFPNTKLHLEYGENYMHAAVRSNSKNMVALLLSFGFDFLSKVENSRNETPEQLAVMLKTSCLKEGWKQYYNAERLKVINLLILFVQAKRQKSCKFSRVPDQILEMLLPFVSRETFVQKDKFKFMQDSLVKVSASCLVKSYQNTSKLLGRHSATSQKFIGDLTGILGKGENIAHDVAEIISPFLKEVKGEKTRTMGLLSKYKLLAIAAPEKKEVKVKDKTTAKRPTNTSL